AGMRSADARRAALLLLDAGELAPSDVLLAAARDARLAGDHAAAIRLAQASLEGGGGAEAGHLLGEALDVSGSPREAEGILRTAARDAVDARQRTTIALARADNLIRGLGRAADADEVLVETRATLTDPSDQAEIDGQ